MHTQYQIAVLSTSSKMTEKIRDLAKKLGKTYLIYEVPVRDAVRIATGLTDKNVKVFISRGNTTRQLRQHFPIPVVNIDHTFNDCYASYLEARKISPRVAFAAASEDFARILGKYREFLQGAAIYHLDPMFEPSRIAVEIRKMREEDGIGVLIGGVSHKPLADEQGLSFVMSDADEDQILASFEAAEHFLSIETELHARAHELRNRLEIINSILDCTSEGVIRIDHDGIVTNINAIAQKLLNDDALGNNIKQYLPSAKFAETIGSGATITDEIIPHGDSALVLNIVPTIVEDTVTGAVVTLQKQAHIERTEHKIRFQLLNKGHVSDRTFADILGESESIRSAKSLAAKYAAVNSTVLILGDTGTGKELFAQSIHNASKRRRSPFVAINCSAFPPSILESELFGHVKGAFTGALNEGRPGIFELAHRGTIFLDEISETPLDVQLKLLRVIQERKIVRIGDDNVIPVDVRIITASNRDLWRMVRDGLFREDFYYRICVLELRVPTLAERQADIPVLVRHFLENEFRPVCQITASALERLCKAKWRGNIRQLRNMIERLVVTCDKRLIDDDTISRSGVIAGMDDGGGNGGAENKAPATALAGPLHDRGKMAEAELIRQVLSDNRGNRELSAAQLGVSVSTLFRKMKQIRAEHPDFFALVKYPRAAGM